MPDVHAFINDPTANADYMEAPESSYAQVQAFHSKDT